MLHALNLIVEVYQVALVFGVSVSWIRFPEAARVRVSWAQSMASALLAPLRWIRQVWPLRYGGVDFSPVYLFTALEIVSCSLEGWEALS